MTWRRFQTFRTDHTKSMMSLWCDLTEISGLMGTKGHAPLSGECFPSQFFWHHVVFGNRTKPDGSSSSTPRIIASCGPAWSQPGSVRCCPCRPPWGEFCRNVWSALRGGEPWGRSRGAEPASPRRRCRPGNGSLRGWSPCEHRWSCRGSNLEERTAAEWTEFAAICVVCVVCFI